jgi:hypothetical protein
MNFGKARKPIIGGWKCQPEIQSETGKIHLYSCSYNDYQQACREELPERWIKAYQKLS